MNTGYKPIPAKLFFSIKNKRPSKHGVQEEVGRAFAAM